MQENSFGIRANRILGDYEELVPRKLTLRERMQMIYDYKVHLSIYIKEGYIMSENKVIEIKFGLVKSLRWCGGILLFLISGFYGVTTHQVNYIESLNSRNTETLSRIIDRNEKGIDQNYRSIENLRKESMNSFKEVRNSINDIKVSLAKLVQASEK